MIIYFVSALLISAAVYMLGSYATIVSLLFTTGKVVVGLVGFAALVVLYKMFRKKRHSLKLPERS